MGRKAGREGGREGGNEREAENDPNSHLGSSEVDVAFFFLTLPPASSVELLFRFSKPIQNKYLACILR